MSSSSDSSDKTRDEIRDLLREMVRDGVYLLKVYGKYAYLRRTIKLGAAYGTVTSAAHYLDGKFREMTHIRMIHNIMFRVMCCALMGPFVTPLAPIVLPYKVYISSG